MCVCRCSYLCGGSADDQEDSTSPERSGFAFLQEQGDSQTKNWLESPLLVDWVNSDKSPSFPEPPFPHMRSASWGSTDPS